MLIPGANNKCTDRLLIRIGYLLFEGYSLTKISEQIDVAPRTISRWIRRYPLIESVTIQHEQKGAEFLGWDKNAYPRLDYPKPYNSHILCHNPSRHGVDDHTWEGNIHHYDTYEQKNPYPYMTDELRDALWRNM